VGCVKRKKGYVAAKVWRALRDHPGITQRELAALLGWTSNRTACALRNLRLGGHARHGGMHQVYTQWFAVGKQAPVNRSGAHPNSMQNLLLCQADYIKYLRMAFAARGHDPALIGKGPSRKFNKRPFGECALAQIWTMPNSGTKRAA
jgi:hypothetical protein